MPPPKEPSALKTLAETSPSYITDSLIHFKPGADLTQAVKQYLGECRQIVMTKLDEGTPAGRVAWMQSLMTDRLLVALFKQAFEGIAPETRVPLAIFALGGYGRAELNLFSDIDLLFLFEGKVASKLESVIKKMLYPLWDSQVELGYATRTLTDCKRIMQDDVRAMSSMLDARFLAGDRAVAEKYLAYLESRFSSAKALKQFVAAKTKETEERLKRFGGSVYVLEPNLKESEGGLRDWHLLRYYARIALKTPVVTEWVERGLLSGEEADSLDRGLDFLLNVRNRLHRLASRSQDQMLFEQQKTIASQMGFSDDADMLGVERFMQAYYGHAATLHRLLGEVTRRLLKPEESTLSRIKKRLKNSLSENFFSVQGKVIAKSYAALEADPVELTRAFYLAQQHGLKVDDELKSWIGRHLNLVDDAYRHNPEVGAMLREMFADVGGIGMSLWEMHECRLLGALLPEFGDILFQTQHDAYHVYTVDTHSLLAVAGLSELKKAIYDKEFPLFRKALEEIGMPGPLVLGVLFHDIGKGRGGSHSEKGAALAHAITTRLGYSPGEISQVEFLVRSHLIMPLLSQRRDLEDSSLIAQFARSMATLEHLNGLFILTWADIRAVGPDVWTPWKGTLLQQLYTKTRNVLETGEFNAERAAVSVRQAKQEITGLAGSDMDRNQLKKFLDSMPPRYFLAIKPLRILKHFELIQNQSQEGLIFSPQPDEKKNLTRILLYTVNSPRLFEQVTGVMAANQVNILAFEQFFSSHGEALLLLKVTDQRGQLLEEERRLKGLEADLRQVLQGRASMEKYSQAQQGRMFFQKKVAQDKPPRVEIDNDVSAYYTVIDVYANDRIGILHDIARAMTRLGLYIEVSKISTKVDQVADVFYVKDIFGHKITDSKKIAGIRKTLLEALTIDQGQGTSDQGPKVDQGPMVDQGQVTSDKGPRVDQGQGADQGQGTSDQGPKEKESVST